MYKKDEASPQPKGVEVGGVFTPAELYSDLVITDLQQSSAQRSPPPQGVVLDMDSTPPGRRSGARSPLSGARAHRRPLSMTNRALSNILGSNPFPSPFVNLQRVDSLHSNSSGHGGMFLSRSNSKRTSTGDRRRNSMSGRYSADIEAKEPSRAGFDFDNMQNWMETLLTHTANFPSGSSNNFYPVSRTRSEGTTESMTLSNGQEHMVHSSHSNCSNQSVGQGQTRRGSEILRMRSAPSDPSGNKRPSIDSTASKDDGIRRIVSSDLRIASADRLSSRQDDAPEKLSLAMEGRASPPSSAHGERASRTSSRAGDGREDLVRARWKKAMWYAIGEGQQRRTRSQLSSNCARLESGFSFIDSIVGERAIIPADSSESTRPLSNVVSRAKHFLDSACAQVVLTLVTVYVLVVPEAYWLIVTSPSNDKVLLTVTFIVACILVLEILCRLVAERRYRMSVLLLVDGLATVSLLSQIWWLFAGVDPLAGTDGLGAARAVRVVQLGARVIRMARLARILLRLRHWNMEKARADAADVDVAELVEQNGMGLGFGEMLQDGAFLVLVSTVFALLLVVLGTEVFLSNDDSNHLAKLSLCSVSRSVQRAAQRTRSARDHELESGALAAPRGLAMQGDVQQRGWEQGRGDGSAGRERVTRSGQRKEVDGGLDSEVEQALGDAMKWLKEGNKEILLLEVGGQVVYGSEALVKTKREYPVEWWPVEVGPDDGCVAGRLVVDDRANARKRYGSEILLVSCVLVVVAAGTWLMNHKLWHMAGLPIWRMLVFVQKYADNPLGRMPFPDQTQHRELIGLHTALVKLACLLQLAWGVAGARVIGQSLRGEPQEVATIVHAFFGFCDIRNFTGLTEVLESEVVHVVNGIAQYVHAAVGASGGFANKNIGDAFLLVWKPSSEKNIQDVALHGLLSYIQIIVELSRSKVLNRWLKSEIIQDALPGYKLELGFGLHHGWAVEGSVGSPMKIDATYISPHVNMASRLEAATKQYGVMILLSGEAHGLLPIHVQRLCRRVDRVRVKGSNRPVNLWTYDVPKLKRFGGSLDNFINITEPSVSADRLMERLPPSTSPFFRERFREGMDLYLGGPDGRSADWAAATAVFKSCLQLEGHEEDGPCRAVIDYMRRTREIRPLSRRAV